MINRYRSLVKHWTDSFYNNYIIFLIWDANSFKISNYFIQIFMQLKKIAHSTEMKTNDFLIERRS